MQITTSLEDNIRVLIKEVEDINVLLMPLLWRATRHPMTSDSTLIADTDTLPPVVDGNKITSKRAEKKDTREGGHEGGRMAMSSDA